ncbi:MAG: hypothetical protein GWO24_16740, partial [Akkermansiaceae bacterium]|nr:hypothetical protein [Akkermansiaceae bacterium]
MHVLYGQPGGWPASIDLKPGALPAPDEMRIALVRGAKGTSGSDLGDILCYSAASGDIDGDGRLDLIVNEMAGNAVDGTEDVGNMLVIDATSLLGSFQPSLQAVPAGPVQFGAVQLGSASPVRKVVFTNQRGEPVTINSLVLTGPAAGDFAVSSDTGETVLGGGDFRIVTVAFSPSVVGRSGAALVLQTDVDPHPVAVGLAGLGVDTA